MSTKQPIYTLNSLSDVVKSGKNVIISGHVEYTPEEIRSMSYDALVVLLDKGAHYEIQSSKLQWME